MSNTPPVGLLVRAKPDITIGGGRYNDDGQKDWQSLGEVGVIVEVTERPHAKSDVLTCMFTCGRIGWIYTDEIDEILSDH